MKIAAVIFDLDGVIVSTDELHFRAWKRIADEHAIYFDQEINQRLRGVSRMESLDIILEQADGNYSDEEKRQMAQRKNECYRNMLEQLGPKDLLPGAMATLRALKEQRIRIAMASSSRNAPLILQHLGLEDTFEATVDGNDLSKTKPDPEVFQLAASRLGVEPEHCLVVEDANAGVKAALAGNMWAMGVGTAAEDERAHIKASDLASIAVNEMLEVGRGSQTE